MKSLLHTPASKPKLSYTSPGLWAICFFFITAFIMGLLKIYSPDLGFHLKSAEWIIHHKQFIYTDTFNYTAEGHSYTDLQWLYQLLVYALYEQGEPVLIIANSLLICLSLGLVLFRFMRFTQPGDPGIKLGFFAFMAIVLIQPLSFEIRPQVLSGIFLNLVLIFLESYKKGNKGALYALPVLMLIWANTHSLAVLGLVTMAIYNAGNYLEKKSVDKRLLLFSGLSFASLLMTPYLMNGLLYSLSQFGLISGNNLLKSYLGELQSPFTAREINMLGVDYLTSPLLIIHLSAIVSSWSIIRSLKQKQFTDTLLLAAYLVLLYMAHRNYGFFILVSLPLFVKYLGSWPEQGRKQKTTQTKNMAAPARQQLFERFSAAAVIIAVFISITVITDGYALFRHSPNRFGFTTDRDQLPVDATAFLNNGHIKGKLLNHLDFGGYVMAHYDEKVFTDGRMDVLEEDFFEKYYESFTERNGMKKLLDEYDPNIVIFPYVKASAWWEYFIAKGKQSGYKAVYFDGLAVIYLKSAAYPGIQELKQENILSRLDPAALKRVNGSILTIKPKGLGVLIRGLWQKQSFSIADQNKATYCFTNRFDSAGLIYSVMGIENSTIHTPNIFRNLSIYFRDKKMYTEAAWCEDRSE